MNKYKYSILIILLLVGCNGGGNSEVLIDDEYEVAVEDHTIIQIETEEDDHAKFEVEIWIEDHVDIPGVYRHDILIPKVAESVVNGEVINDQIENMFRFSNPKDWSEDDYIAQTGWEYTWIKRHYEVSNINGICSLNLFDETTSVYGSDHPRQIVVSFYYDENKGEVITEDEYLESIGYTKQYILDSFNDIYGEKYKNYTYGFNELLYYFDSNEELHFFTRNLDILSP